VFIIEMNSGEQLLCAGAEHPRFPFAQEPIVWFLKWTQHLSVKFQMLNNSVILPLSKEQSIYI